MVQTVQQFIEIPQLQFVARWSMSLLGTWMCRKLWEIPQLQFIKVVDTLFVTQRLISTVLVTMEIPQLLVDTVVDLPVLLVVLVPQVPSWRRQTCSTVALVEKLVAFPDL